MNVFVDTNVLIDFVCNRYDFYDIAESTFALGLSGKANIWFSDISVINTLYVGKKYGYTQHELCQQILNLLNFCNTSQIDRNVVVNALNSGWNDTEDAMQYFSAKATSCDFIVTRNPKDFIFSDINVITPKEFVLSFS